VFNAENTVGRAIQSILAQSLSPSEILIIDDNSRDKTKEEIKKIKFENNQIKIKCLFNKSNQGYGGNQKIGYRYAIKYQFDYVFKTTTF
jgi:glycosyltransferase involved in cell wall biosynthesis